MCVAVLLVTSPLVSVSVQLWPTVLGIRHQQGISLTFALTLKTRLVNQQLSSKMTSSIPEVKDVHKTNVMILYLSGCKWVIVMARCETVASIRVPRPRWRLTVHTPVFHSRYTHDTGAHRCATVTTHLYSQQVHTGYRLTQVCNSDNTPVSTAGTHMIQMHTGVQQWQHTCIHSRYTHDTGAHRCATVTTHLYPQQVHTGYRLTQVCNSDNTPVSTAGKHMIQMHTGVQQWQHTFIHSRYTHDTGSHTCPTVTTHLYPPQVHTLYRCTKVCNSVTQVCNSDNTALRGCTAVLQNGTRQSRIADFTPDHTVVHKSNKQNRAAWLLTGAAIWWTWPNINCPKLRYAGII